MATLKKRVKLVRVRKPQWSAVKDKATIDNEIAYLRGVDAPSEMREVNEQQHLIRDCIDKLIDFGKTAADATSHDNKGDDHRAIEYIHAAIRDGYRAVSMLRKRSPREKSDE